MYVIRFIRFLKLYRDMITSSLFLLLSLPAQEIVHFMAQFLRHRRIGIKDAAIVDVRRNHHQQEGVLPLALAIQTDLLAMTVFFFFLCQVGEVRARRTGRLGESSFLGLFIMCVCMMK